MLLGVSVYPCWINKRLGSLKDLKFIFAQSLFLRAINRSHTKDPSILFSKLSDHRFLFLSCLVVFKKVYKPDFLSPKESREPCHLENVDISVFENACGFFRLLLLMELLLIIEALLPPLPEISSAEKLRKNILEASTSSAKVKMKVSKISSPSLMLLALSMLINSFLTILIINFPLFRILQGLVRVDYFLKLFLGLA